MKVRQGAELPDELVFKQVADNNELARVTIVQLQDLERIISQAERDKLMDRRFKVARKRLWFLERRKDMK